MRRSFKQTFALVNYIYENENRVLNSFVKRRFELILVKQSENEKGYNLIKILEKHSEHAFIQS